MGIGSCASGFFVFLAGRLSSDQPLRLTPTQYSLAFSFNAVVSSGPAFTATLGQRFAVAHGEGGGHGLGSTIALLLAYYLLGGDSLWVLIALNFIASAFMGLGFHGVGAGAGRTRPHRGTACADGHAADAVGALAMAVVACSPTASRRPWWWAWRWLFSSVALTWMTLVRAGLAPHAVRT